MAEEDRVMDILAETRQQCRALNLILIPEDTWANFLEWHGHPDEVALHRSVCVLALLRGCLARITSPIHRYLLVGEHTHPNLRTQYLKDLSERWMHCQDAGTRHQRHRAFAGRLAELQFAEWLESQQWTISGLEALREGPDVEAHFFRGSPTAFEIKFIGTEDKDFQAMVNSLSGDSRMSCVSPYLAANYLILRVYEAARQLLKTSVNRVVVVVVQELGWYRFQVQVKNRWIDWRNPQFFDDPEWETFLERQKRTYPRLPEDLEEVISGVNEVWIMRRDDRYRFKWGSRFVKSA